MPFSFIPKTTRLAILLPTFRWNPEVQSILAGFVGVASEEISVLIADNSENIEKHQFLQKIKEINPFIQYVAHPKNIGVVDNFNYLYDWSAHIEFMAIMADDDVVSPTYYLDGYQALLNQPSASCISVGTSFADFGNGGLHNITQPSMRGGRTIERMLAWSGIAARITMYDVSRRAAITQGLAYLRATPLQGLTLAEDLIELSRLAHGDFIQLSGRGFFVHYPHHGAHDGGGTERFYELLCKPVGLNYNMVYFMALSTAIQCAIFLLGKYSPIKNINERMECAQYIFKKIYIESFLPKVAADGASEAASMLFSDHPNALAGFKKYCNLKNLDELVFDIDLLNWFLEILSVFEDRNKALENRISEKFKNFCIDVLN